MNFITKKTMAKINNISFNKALTLIQQGEVVAIPTETVYGLAGSAFNNQVLKKIFQIKKRPFFNPLIIHCANIQQMNQFFFLSTNINTDIKKNSKSEKPQNNTNEFLLKKIISYFMPGPLTLILPKTNLVDPLITAGQEKVGLRIPKHPLTLKLIQTTNALCAPSANLFGELSPTRAEHIHSIFQGMVPVLDGGECNVGIESTVLEPDFKNKIFKILRPGMISKKDLETWLKKENKKDWEVIITSSSLSPGQLKKHYQPKVPLVIIENQSNNNILKKENISNKLSSIFVEKIFKELKLKSSAELSARILYHELNTLSNNPAHLIYIIKYKKMTTEPWQAIWDRLEKACSYHIKWMSLNPQKSK